MSVRAFSLRLLLKSLPKRSTHERAAVALAFRDRPLGPLIDDGHERNAKVIAPLVSRFTLTRHTATSMVIKRPKKVLKFGVCMNR